MGRGECLVEEELVFEDAVDAFGHGVLVAVVLLGHAGEYAVAEQAVGVGGGAVLDAPVGVVDKPRSRAGHLQSSLEGSQAARQLQGIADVVADHAAGVEVGDQGQVAEPVGRPEVGDVRDPYLVGAGDLQAADEVAVAVEPVAGVGGPARGPPGGNQQAPLPQQREQPVPAHPDPLHIQLHPQGHV